MATFGDCIICGEPGAPWQPNGEFRHFTCWDRPSDNTWGEPKWYDVPLWIDGEEAAA